MGPEEFQRALITVLVVGSIVMGVGATAVFFILRGFGKGPGSTKHIAIAVGLFVFILLCCLALFAVAYLGDR